MRLLLALATLCFLARLSTAEQFSGSGKHVKRKRRIFPPPGAVPLHESRLDLYYLDSLARMPGTENAYPDAVCNDGTPGAQFLLNHISVAFCLYARTIFPQNVLAEMAS